MTGDIDDSSCMVVDKDDLEKKIWTCSKYTSLYERSNNFCASVFDSSMKFRVHVRKHHRNAFPLTFACPIPSCKESSKKYTRIQHLQNHYDCVHRQSRDFICHVCTKSFSSQKTWTRHVKNCTAGTLNCKYCPKSFTGYSTLSRHCRTVHLDEINKDKPSEDNTRHQTEPKDSSVKYLLVPVQSVIVQGSESHISNTVPAVDMPVQNEPCIESQYPDIPGHKKLKPNPIQHAASQASIWQNAYSQTSSSWNPEDMATPAESCRSAVSWTDDGVQHFSGGYDDGLRDKELFPAIDNIHGHTQTEEFWGYNEFSTQTAAPVGTEQSSFGTQTRCPKDDLLDPFIGADHCDLVEFLDSEVQTESHAVPGSTSFASQTTVSSESFTNDRSCGIERSDRDCQTYFYKNSIQTQTKLRRERSLIVVDGLNSETQTASPDQMSVFYNESFTQTMNDSIF